MLRLLLLIAFPICLSGTAAAQTPPSRAPSTATEALVAFDEVRHGAEAGRATAVRAMGRFADEQISDLLLDELAASTDPSYRAALADALGGSARPRALDPLTALLTAPESAPALRSAAARGLARQGEQGEARLLEAAGTAGTDAAASSTRIYALMGLSQAGTDSAWRALATVASNGEVNERRTALRYLERAPDLPEIIDALLVGARDGDLSTAATSSRQLAERGHAGAGDLVADAVARAATTNAHLARSDLLRGMIASFGPRFHEPFLVMGSGADATTDRLLEPLLPKVTDDAKFVAWLRKALPRRQSPAERRFGLHLLGAVPGAEVTAEIAQHARAREPEVATTALRVLGRRGDPTAIPELRKLLRSKDEARRVDTMLALHDLLRTEPAWREELRSVLKGATRAHETTLRTLTLDLLADLQDFESLAAAWKDLDRREWTLRAGAIDFCRRVRDPRSVPKLIERLDEESGRLREDVLDALQAMTAMRFMQQHRWEEWWEGAQSGFELVPADVLANRKKPRPQQGATTSYYGIPLVSERVVFVVDVSGSMSAQIGTDASQSRLDEAKRQLQRVLEATPKHFQFNIVPFHTTVSAVFDRMMPAAEQARAEALREIAELTPMGGTNVHDAMLRAFEETEVDTIYLLSDGSPSGGPITDPDALADEIARWNRARRLRIHCISIGTDNAMLQRIAAESGGKYASSW